MESTNYWKCILNFLSSFLMNWQWLFQQPNHSTYSKPSTQVASTAEQGFWHCFTDRLNQNLVSSVAQAIILWDRRENFSRDDGTIPIFGVFHVILNFLSSNKIHRIYHLYFFSSSSKKNINSVSSQYRSIMTGHHFLLVTAASGEPCILLCTCR